LRQDANAQDDAAPLLFDEAFRPKPAYEALAEVLRKR
jgi:GH35 family endo-1,4-beta-xylanase